MRIAALAIKTVRTYFLVWGSLTLVLAVFAVLYMHAATTILSEMQTYILKMEWIRRLIIALSGADVTENFTATGLAAFAFSHPFTWAILLACGLTVASGSLAGDIDRGTIDVLATLPISRTGIYVAQSAATLLVGLPICGALQVGVWIGSRMLHLKDVDISGLGRVALHLYITFVFIACFAVMASAAGSRRGTAVAVPLAMVFYSFALNLLAAFWAPAGRAGFTGFLHYYRPLPIIRAGAMQWGDVTCMLGAAAVCWVAGLVVFRRRDFRTT